MLEKLGISAQLASQNTKSGWLERLAYGVYCFPGDELRLYDCIKFLQPRVKGLHVASKSALALHGTRHNLAARQSVELWGDQRFQLPEWFTSRFQGRYSSAKLFDWKSTELAAKTVTTPPGITEGLKVSVPERAVLELLSEVGTHQELEEARNLFDGLRPPRLKVLGELLSCCVSVKTTRLFLTWARETKIIDVNRLEQEFHLPTGSNKRWMKRLKDGTLLTLMPHG
jgi:hypothetical protein